MSNRLLKLSTIRKEKLDRSRAWFWGEIAAGRFPKPAADDLWSEPEVDVAITAYIERLRASGRRATNARDGASKRDSAKARNEPRAVE